MAAVWKAWLALAAFWTCFFIVFSYVCLLPRHHSKSTLEIYHPSAASVSVATTEIQTDLPSIKRRNKPSVSCRVGVESFRASVGTQNGSHNLCLEERLAPSLYVLGAQKAGTSSFSQSLQSHDVFFAPSLVKRTNTEWNFFVWKLMQFGGLSSAEAERNLWLKTLPHCANDVSVLLADDSPDYLAMVPLPPGTEPLGYHWGPLYSKELCHMPILFKSWRAPPNCRGAPEMNLPRKLNYFYGPQVGAQIAFLVLLREPLERMHSAWYQALRQEFRLTCSDCKASSFERALVKAMQAATRTPPSYHDWFWFSLYARHLQHWLFVFSPRQFYLVPMRMFLQCGIDTCNELSQFHKFRKDCSEFKIRNFGFAATDRPDLDRDLSENARKEFERIMSPEIDMLIDVLWNAHKEGAHLVGFQRQGDSQEEIREWLLSSW